MTFGLLPSSIYGDPESKTKRLPPGDTEKKSFQQMGPQLCLYHDYKVKNIYSKYKQCLASRKTKRGVKVQQDRMSEEEVRQTRGNG